MSVSPSGPMHSGYQPVAPPPRKSRRGAIAAVVGAGLLVLALIGGGIFWAVRGGPTPSPTGGPSKAVAAPPACGFKIAYLGPLTGNVAADGISVRDSAKLAVEQYNRLPAHAACKADLAEFDTKEDPTEAANLAARLAADDKILGVVGPLYSDEVTGAVPVLEQHGLPMISPSVTDPTLAHKGWTVFHRLISTDAEQAAAGAAYLTGIAKKTRTFVVADDGQYASVAGPEVQRRLGETAIGTASIKRATKEYSAVVQQVVASGADSVYYAGAYDDGAVFVKQLRTAKPGITVVGSDRIFTGEFVTTTGSTGEGVVMTCGCVPPPQADQNFAEEFKSFIGQDANYYGPESFDATNIFLSGLSAGKATRADMLAYVSAYEGRGVSRSIKFTVNGDLNVANPLIWAYVQHGDGVEPDQVIPAK